MNTHDTNELSSLVRLLDDPDPVVREAVVGRLTELGTPATVQLRDIIEGEAQVDDLVRTAATEALNEIGQRRMLDELARASEQEEFAEDNTVRQTFDLEIGAFAVAMHRFPDLNPDGYRSQLNTMGDLLRWRTRDFDKGIDTIREINYYMVQQQAWRGVSQKHYHNPDNSCLNRVIDRRRGIPITMSVVWLLIAKRLNLPLYGVSFPVHFLCRYRSDSEDFLIDPFNGGVVVTEEQCKAFIESLGVEFNEAFLEPVDERHIVARMLRNMAEIYRENEPARAQGMEEAIRLLSVEWRGGGSDFGRDGQV